MKASISSLLRDSGTKFHKCLDLYLFTLNYQGFEILGVEMNNILAKYSVSNVKKGKVEKI